MPNKECQRNIQISSNVAASEYKKARLTNDVRYQEFNEVTPDGSVKRSGVTSFFGIMDSSCGRRLDIVVGIWYSVNEFRE